ncbi:MAG: hypothetical protein KDB02_00220 [Acidimicrobiales bacterium]|nr:hypothetical protein [Acidimicrobiales bacterium]
MSELTARLALFGAIDAVLSTTDDHDLLSAAEDALPAYRDKSTVGWFEAFRALVGTDKSGKDLIGEPDLDAALEELGRLDRPSPIDAAHRLIALWATQATILPDARERLGPALRSVVSAVPMDVEPAVVEADGEGDGDGGADHLSDGAVDGLLDLLPRYETFESLPELLDKAEELSLLPRRVVAAARVMVTMRSGTKLIRLRGSHAAESSSTVATEIVTQVTIPEVGRTIDEVRQRMSPQRWPQCLPNFWCGMDHSVDAKPDDGIDYYIERVGDCPNVWFDPCLRFGSQDVRDAAGTVVGFEIFYGMWGENDPPGAVKAGTSSDGRLLADDGMIHAELSGSALVITFSKAIALAGNLPTASIALIVGATGWADQTAAMAIGCLA